MARSAALPNRFLRIVQFPIVRLILGFVWLLGVVIVAQVLIQPLAVANVPVLHLAGGLIVVAVSVLAYIAFVRVVERRSVVELSTGPAPAELAIGIVVGALLFSATIGFISLLGYYRIIGVNDWLVAVPIFANSLVSGAFEEILFRGLLFRITQESLGTWLALLISALIFGLLHLLNPNATLVAALAVALEAGVMLAAAYVLTGRLWLSMGIHFAWNFTQGGIFGAAVSGQASTGLFRSVLQGPVLLTGGDFGAEASAVAVVVCGLFGAYLLARAWREGKFVKPFWLRGK
jgi:membrane protease YdiL (CAAX protease family)